MHRDEWQRILFVIGMCRIDFFQFRFCYFLVRFLNTGNLSLFFTARCYAQRGYATVCRLSVCLWRSGYSGKHLLLSDANNLNYLLTYLLTLLWVCDHIGWNTSKIISRPNSLRYGTYSHWPQHRRSGPTETPPKLGWNSGGVMSTKTCDISETMQHRTMVTMTN